MTPSCELEVLRERRLLCVGPDEPRRIEALELEGSEHVLGGARLGAMQGDRRARRDRRPRAGPVHDRLVPGRPGLRRRQLDEAGSCIGVVDADGELLDEQIGELVGGGVAEFGRPQRLVDARRADDPDPARRGHVAKQAHVPADADAGAVDEEVDPRGADLG